MKTTAYPDPPNPADPQYSKSSQAYNLAMYRWASQMKSELQGKGRVNDRAAFPSFSVSSYTQTNTNTLSGTDTTTNVAQVLCNLITALTNKGILKPNKTNQ